MALPLVEKYAREIHFTLPTTEAELVSMAIFHPNSRPKWSLSKFLSLHLTALRRLVNNLNFNFKIVSRLLRLLGLLLLESLLFHTVSSNTLYCHVFCRTKFVYSLVMSII